MITQDIAELRQHALDLFETTLADVPLFIADVDDVEPDEQGVWCVFVVNPDTNEEATIGINSIYDQRGTANLMITQPKGVEIATSEYGAWDIAEIAMRHFRSLTGDDNRLRVIRTIPSRIPNDDGLQVNLLILYRSRHTS